MLNALSFYVEDYFRSMQFMGAFIHRFATLPAEVIDSA